MCKISKMLELIAESHRIVAFTGAGVSTDSGIPDVDGILSILNRDSDYHGDAYNLVSQRFARSEPATFYRIYRKTFFHPDARPNSCHHFLVDLEKAGKLAGVVTMNIDYLHQKAGSRQVCEYWGDMRKNRCVNCNRLYDWSLLENQNIPKCRICGGLIIPDFVYRDLRTYPNEVANGEKMIESADLLLILGTRRQAGSFPSAIKKIVVSESASPEDGVLTINQNINDLFIDLSEKYHALY